VKYLSIFIAAILMGVGLQSIAHSQGDSIEKAISYRQSGFQMMAWHFKPMGAMVQGKSEWDLALFQKHASAVAALAPLPINGFIADSDMGDTHAKGEIWENWDDFSEKMQALVAETAALAKTASGGDKDAIKDQFIKTAGTCKSCHKKYREKM
jgi:cytochrome c556